MRTRPGYDSEQIRNLAYADILENLTNRQAAVYQMIIEFGPISTEKIAELMDVYPNFITGRIKELRDDLQLIEIAGVTITEKGNSKAALYKAKKWNAQMAFKFC